MLFSFISTVIIAITFSLAVVFSYRIGVIDGENIAEQNISLEKYKENLPEKKMDKYDIILENIDSYNGSSAGQKEVG